jgi:Uma2 family endonuclease
MGYRFEDDAWLVPDVSITHVGQHSNDYFLGAPALAIEIVSEGQTADSIDSKTQHYLDHGALQVWVVYPNRRYLWIYEKGGKGEMRSGSFASDLLGGAIIDLNQFFGPEN